MIKQLVMAKAVAHMYHGTGLQAAASILKNNKFVLKPSSGTEYETKLTSEKSPYYLSCARSIRSSYIEGLSKSWLVVFEMDGRALATRYRIRPVDYWGSPERDEMEERVMSRDPTIPAAPYIKKVMAVIPDRLYAGHKKALRTILFECKKRGLPIDFYASPDGVFDPRQQKPIQLDLDTLRIDEEDKKYHRDPYLHLTGWLALYKMPVSEKPRLRQHEDAYRKYHNLRYASDVRILDADLHNAKGDREGKSRAQLEEFMAILRKNKWTTKDFFEAMAKKWYN